MAVYDEMKQYEECCIYFNTAQTANGYTYSTSYDFDSEIRLSEWNVYGLGHVATRYPEPQPLQLNTTKELLINGNSRIPVSGLGSFDSRFVGHTEYLITDHLGDIRLSFTDRKMPKSGGGYQLEPLNISNYISLDNFCCFAIRILHRKC